MRELILSTALRLFVEDFTGTTMRRLADEIEYTPGAIYSYFKDKDEICYALHHRGFDLLDGMMQAALATVDDTLERLRVIGDCYIAFALEHRALYNLMFISQKMGKKIAEADDWAPGKRALGTLREACVAFIDQHRLDWDPDVTAYSCWSHAHGLVSLVLCDRCAPIPADQQPAFIHAAHAQYVDVLAAAAAKKKKRSH